MKYKISEKGSPNGIYVTNTETGIEEFIPLTKLEIILNNTVVDLEKF